MSDHWNTTGADRSRILDSLPIQRFVQYLLSSGRTEKLPSTPQAAHALPNPVLTLNTTPNFTQPSQALITEAPELLLARAAQIGPGKGGGGPEGERGRQSSSSSRAVQTPLSVNVVPVRASPSVSSTLSVTSSATPTVPSLSVSASAQSASFSSATPTLTSMSMSASEQTASISSATAAMTYMSSSISAQSASLSSASAMVTAMSESVSAQSASLLSASSALQSLSANLSIMSASSLSLSSELASASSALGYTSPALVTPSGSLPSGFTAAPVSGTTATATATASASSSSSANSGEVFVSANMLVWVSLISVAVSFVLFCLGALMILWIRRRIRQEREKGVVRQATLGRDADSGLFKMRSGEKGARKDEVVESHVDVRVGMRECSNGGIKEWTWMERDVPGSEAMRDISKGRRETRARGAVHPLDMNAVEGSKRGGGNRRFSWLGFGGAN